MLIYVLKTSEVLSLARSQCQKGSSILTQDQDAPVDRLSILKATCRLKNYICSGQHKAPSKTMKSSLL